MTVHSGFTDVDDLLSVRTTPLECLDVVVCRVVDDVGSEGEGRFRISNVTGECVCECVCVCVRERERDNVCVCV